MKKASALSVLVVALLASGLASARADVPTQTITVSVRDSLLPDAVPQLTNDPNVTIDPLAAPVVAQHQQWPAWFETTATYHPMLSATIDPPLPDGEFLRISYAIGFIEGSPTYEHIQRCNVTGAGGECDPGAETFSNTPGAVAYPSFLWADVMVPDVNGEPQVESELTGYSPVTVFLPPSCGAVAEPKCPSDTLLKAFRTSSQSTSTSRTVRYYWRQVFDGTDYFIVKHGGVVIHRRAVAGSAGAVHYRKWECPRSGVFTLVVKGQNAQGVWRHQAERKVRCR